MFSGIVEEYAEVVKVVKDQENLHLTLKCSFVDELKIDQSGLGRRHFRRNVYDRQSAPLWLRDAGGTTGYASTIPW